MKPDIQIKMASGSPAEEKCDALVLFIPEKDFSDEKQFRQVDQKMKGNLSALLREEKFQAKVGETILYHTQNAITPRRVIVAGTGKKSEWSEEVFRRASCAAVQTARNAACATVGYVIPDSDLPVAARVQAILEGALLGSYRFTKFKTKEEEIQPEKKVQEIRLLGARGGSLNSVIARTEVYCAATCLARDLVNEPGNALNPEILGDYARKLAKESGLRFRLIEAVELEKLGAGLILGVGRGSAVPPRMIELRYRPTGIKKAKRKVALVGKGITFDSGGLSLKSSRAMEGMKSDMAGAAAVLCAMWALPKLKPKVEVLGILCIAENMPSGSAIRPGDILRAMNGKSVEVINTDAEGRLVLGDGLSWAVQQGATELIDLATLTGACVIGLGPYIAGIMGNNEELLDRIVEAGKAVGEQYWKLPIPADYDFMIKSDVADIKNLGPNSEAGAIQGALFLKEFVGDTRWAHLDIAGPSWYEKEFFHWGKNGTGFGVRTILEYLSR